MGSKEWNNKKSVRCSVCSMWLDSENRGKTPSHKPKGDILSSQDCKGSGRPPSASKGFDFRPYPYKKKMK